MNEMIIIIENTNIPSGSNLLLPTGNFLLSLLIRHPTSLCVVKMIAVHSKSSAESANEAISDRDEELRAATPLAISSIMLAMTLI